MSWKIRLRKSEACEEQPFLSPDIVLTQIGDFYVGFDMQLAEAVERKNKGGLRSRAGLDTAVIIQLFTDARARDDDELLDDLDPDRRGWWGDSVGRVPEQGDHNIGSRLWILRRARLTRNTERIATEICAEALQVIVDQRAVARFDIVAKTNYGKPARHAPETGYLTIHIVGYDHDGSVSYDRRFDALWDQVRALAV